jgi:hypothetical protein
MATARLDTVRHPADGAPRLAAATDLSSGLLGQSSPSARPLSIMSYVAVFTHISERVLTPASAPPVHDTCRNRECVDSARPCRLRETSGVRDRAIANRTEPIAVLSDQPALRPDWMGAIPSMAPTALRIVTMH